jgi:hypothetical protein
VLLLAACTEDGDARTNPEPTPSTSPTAYSIWADDVVPATPATSESRSVTLGVQFSSDVDGVVTGVQFYRAPTNAGPHKGQLWTESGQLLATTRPRHGSSPGWVTLVFAEPVRIKAGATYVAAYTAPHGQYAADQDHLGPKRPAEERNLIAWLGVYTYDKGVPRESWHDTNYYVDPVFRPDAGASASTASATPSPTETSPTETSPTGSPTARDEFPDEATTGVPEGTALTPYTGPCRITRPDTVIDGKVVDCNLIIKAPGVVIRSSVVNGSVANGEDSEGLGFTIEDSEVRLGDRPVTGIGAVDFTVERVEVTGGGRSIYCLRGCTIRDSWVHGQFTDETGVAHESGIRMGSDTTIVHNSIGCDAPMVPPDAGCSAGLTGYGDLGVVQRNLIQANLFLTTPAATCAYGGSTVDKSQANEIRFIDNVFQRGPHQTCGVYAAIMDFDPSAPGNVWSGNRWDDGDPFPSP